MSMYIHTCIKSMPFFKVSQSIYNRFSRTSFSVKTFGSIAEYYPIWDYKEETSSHCQTVDDDEASYDFVCCGHTS